MSGDCDDQDPRVGREDCIYSELTLTEQAGCVVTPSGRLTCWGSPPDFQPEGPWAQVELREGFACGLDTSYKMRCWGETDQQRDHIPADLSLRQFSIGADSVCGVQKDGEILCWGEGADDKAIPGKLPEVFHELGSQVCGLSMDVETIQWGAV